MANSIADSISEALAVNNQGGSYGIAKKKIDSENSYGKTYTESQKAIEDMRKLKESQEQNVKNAEAERQKAAIKKRIEEAKQALEETMKAYQSAKGNMKTPKQLETYVGDMEKNNKIIKEGTNALKSNDKDKISSFVNNPENKITVPGIQKGNPSMGIAGVNKGNANSVKMVDSKGNPVKENESNIWIHYDANGNPSAWGIKGDHTRNPMSTFGKNGSPEGVGGGAPAPAPAHVQGVNQYDQANGQHYYDASAIPEVLDKGRITPSQYVNNNGGNWDKDRERLAKEAGISNYTGTPGQNYRIVQHMEDVKKGTAGTTAAAATTTTPEDAKNKELNTQFFGTYEKDKTFSGNGLPTWLSQEAQDKIINANVGNIYKTDMVKDEALKKVKEMIAKDPTMLQKFGIDSVAYQSGSKEISKDDAMKFLNAGDAYFSKEQKAADKGVSPARVMDKGREALLQDIASGKKAIGKDVQTTLSADEEKYIKQVKLTNYKNIIKKEMSGYLNRMNEALKNKDIEGAKKIKQEWKDYIVNERNKNDNFSIIESELQKETKNIEKGLATPDEDVRVYTEKQPTAPAAPAAPTPTAGTTVDKGGANAPVAPTPTSTIPNPTPVTPGTAGALNTGGAADTLYAKIEQSKNKPDELQSTGAPKNRIKPN